MAIEGTRGIVIQQVKYGDTSIICQIYTEEYGRKSFLFKGIRSKKSKIHSNILQPLSLLNLEAYYKNGKEICLVKEASPAVIFTNFPYDFRKSAQAIFIAEVLSKCLIEEEPNKLLFTFIRSSIEYFDLAEQGTASFHIIFLVKLSRYLGFYPSSRLKPEELIFDMKEGTYKEHFPDHMDFIDPVNSGLLDEMINKNYDQLSGLELNQNMRNELLDLILKFYSFHIEGINRLRSYKVLKEIFS